MVVVIVIIRTIIVLTISKSSRFQGLLLQGATPPQCRLHFLSLCQLILSELIHIITLFHYPKYDDNVCSKLLRPRAEKHQKLLSVGPQGYISAATARNLTTTPKGTKHLKKLRKSFSLGIRATFGVVNHTMLFEHCNIYIYIYIYIYSLSVVGTSLTVQLLLWWAARIPTRVFEGV